MPTLVIAADFVREPAPQDYAPAIAYTTRSLALEPWQEEAHYRLMQWLADGGQRYQSKLFNPVFLREKKLPVPPWMK